MVYGGPVWKQENFTWGMTGVNKMYFFGSKDKNAILDGTPLMGTNLSLHECRSVHSS